MDSKEAINLISRYFILVILALGNLFLIYSIFTPLTLYPVYWILSAMGNTKLIIGNTIFFDGVYIKLIDACIAGTAYYLLFILNLSTPMPLKTRIKSIFFIGLSFLLINIIRIVALSEISIFGNQYFDITHKLFWYAGSTIMIVAIWFLSAWIFKIEEIPIYSDVKSIIKDIKR